MVAAQRSLFDIGCDLLSLNVSKAFTSQAHNAFGAAAGRSYDSG
jgi:hypothetical protein